MTKVGLLSDTHGYWDEKYLQYFEGCDEIWHAGDIGSLEVAQKLAAFRPFRAVYGNIDGQEIRQLYPQILPFHGGWGGGADEAYRRLIPATTTLPSRAAFWCVPQSCSSAGTRIY